MIRLYSLAIWHWKNHSFRRPNVLLATTNTDGTTKVFFNFEGGCYAKTINLTEENEPDIYRAIRTDALLENVACTADGSPDYFDTSKTENGRVSYPIYHIDNWHEPRVGQHPENVIF